MRERITLIRGGAATIVGTVTLTDCPGPFTFDDLSAHHEAHCGPDGSLDEFRKKYKNRAFFVGTLDVERLAVPVSYEHPCGAVIWVTLR